MKKNPFYCCIFFAMVAMAFCACGDGSVDARGGEDELALLNYGPPFVEGDSGNMWTLRSAAIKDCEADDACKAAMEKVDGTLDIPEESSSSEAVSEESSAATESRSSSSRGIVINSAGAPVISTVSSDSQGGSGDVPETSSASVATSSNSSIAGVVLRYCQPAGGVTTVVKGTPVQWQFRTNGEAAKSFSWSFTGADITTSEEESPTTVFAETGVYTPTLTIDGESKPITCNKLTVVGPEVTGCTCGAPVTTSNDLADNNPVVYTWTISGCSSEGSEPLSYQWAGDAKGSSETGTGSYTAKGIYGASATVTNQDGKTAVVTCEKVTVVDANNPNTQIENFQPSESQTQITGPGIYEIAKCNGNTGMRAIQFQIHGISSAEAKAMFSTYSSTDATWYEDSQHFSGQINASFPLVLTIPEGTSDFKWHGGCW